MEIKAGHFVPGFTEQLVGASKGDKRTVTVIFPQEFVAPQLSGKEGVYEVEIVQVKEKVLPELNDEFAKQWNAESFEKLRAGVRQDLEAEAEVKIRRDVRSQLIESVSNRVQCELPDTLVQGETRSTVYNIVAENTQRGVSKEAIDEKKDEIYSYAASTAREKLKVAFLLGRIAEKEGIKITREELMARIIAMANEREMKPEKLLKDLQKSDGFGPIHEQILLAKVVDFLERNAAIEEVQPPPPQPTP
jgi:trigger factor